MKGHKLVDGESEQCNACSVCGSRGCRSPKQNCPQKDCWVIIQLIPCTLRQRWQQIAYCAGRLQRRASFNVLPLPSRTHPRCSPISTVFACERRRVQATDVLVPSLIPVLPRDPLLPLSLHPSLRHSQDLGREKEGWAKGSLRSLYGAGAAVFLSPRLGGFLPMSCFQLLSSQFCSAQLSLPFTVNFGGRKLPPRLAFPNNTRSPRFGRVWGDFLSPFVAQPTDGQERIFSLVLKEKLPF